MRSVSRTGAPPVQARGRLWARHNTRQMELRFVRPPEPAPPPEPVKPEPVKPEPPSEGEPPKGRPQRGPRIS